MINIHAQIQAHIRKIYKCFNARLIHYGIIMYPL